MEITKSNIDTLISQSLSGQLEWYTYGEAPCFNCDINNETIIICKYINRENQTTVSFSCTDDWGNITSETDLIDGDIFQNLSEFYDKIKDKVRVEI